MQYTHICTSIIYMFHRKLSAIVQFSHINYEYSEPIDYVRQQQLQQQTRKNKYTYVKSKSEAAIKKASKWPCRADAQFLKLFAFRNAAQKPTSRNERANNYMRDLRRTRNTQWPRCTHPYMHIYTQKKTHWNFGPLPGVHTHMYIFSYLLLLLLYYIHLSTNLKMLRHLLVWMLLLWCRLRRLLMLMMVRLLLWRLLLLLAWWTVRAGIGIRVIAGGLRVCATAAADVAVVVVYGYVDAIAIGIAGNTAAATANTRRGVSIRSRQYGWAHCCYFCDT